MVVKVLLAPAMAMVAGFMSFSMGLPAIYPPNLFSDGYPCMSIQKITNNKSNIINLQINPYFAIECTLKYSLPTGGLKHKTYSDYGIVFKRSVKILNLAAFSIRKISISQMLQD
jgi:hypothetical protein